MTEWRRIHALLAVTVAAGVMLVAGPSGAVQPPDAGAAPAAAPSGLWIGSTTAKRVRSSRWLSAGTTARGDFWFRLRRNGDVRGYATVALEPAFDSAGLNGLVNYAKSVGTSVLGLVPLPGFGAIASTGVNSIIGVNVTFDETLAVRQGPISGSYRQGRLRLQWAGGDMDGVGFRAFINRVDGTEEISSGTVPRADPWAGTGRADGEAGGWQAVATNRSSSTDDGVTDATSTYWSAHRVGR